jgi:hypothetical protein
MSRACAALSNFNFSSVDSSSLEEDEKVKHKQGDFTGFCLMGKSSRNIFDCDSDVSDDLFLESLSLGVAELENALCNQDKLFCKVFCENKKLNQELENSFMKLLLFGQCTMMSAKPYDNYRMIIVNYADLWLVHAKVASQFDDVKLELRELKTHFILLGACTTCPLFRSDLEVSVIEIKDLKHKLEHPSRYSVLSPPCELCVSLKGKLFHATKENIKLQ